MFSYPDPIRLNADLHCHSNVSDGQLPPAELARLAASNGVRLWALTDHDEVGGVAAAREAARQLGMQFVAGVEISVTWANETLHIVGLNLDETCPTLLAGLAGIRAGRDVRARDMGEQLARAGIPGAYEGAMQFVGNPNLVGRTHFARFLVKQGICDSIGDVFQRYLVAGKPGYVPHRWASLTQAVSWIRGAGGQAVIAHPGRYKLDDLHMHALFEEFKALGGAAIEVVTGSHTTDQYARFARVSLQYGLMASRGSDFHSPDESRVGIGALPLLPDACVPVWADWADCDVPAGNGH
jgi:predicted metal-dependent phosphoesterase TrpH